MNESDYNMIVLAVGLVASLLAEWLPGLSPFWAKLSGKQKRAIVGLGSALVGVLAVLLQGERVNDWSALLDALRYAALTFGASQAGYVYAGGGPGADEVYVMQVQQDELSADNPAGAE